MLNDCFNKVIFNLATKLGTLNNYGQEHFEGNHTNLKIYLSN